MRQVSSSRPSTGMPTEVAARGRSSVPRKGTRQETAACFRTCTQRSSPHTTATTFVSERSATSPDDCISSACAGALIEAMRRSRDPSPWRVFLPVSEQTDRKTRRVCPGMCPNGVPETSGASHPGSVFLALFAQDIAGVEAHELHQIRGSDRHLHDGIQLCDGRGGGNGVVERIHVGMTDGRREPSHNLFEWAAGTPRWFCELQHLSSA
jgi:hypothetical protein